MRVCEGESVRKCEGEVYMRVHNNDAENHTNIFAIDCEGVRV